MREWIKGYLTPPTFESDVEKTLLAQKAHIILLVNLLGTTIAIIALLLAAPERLIRVAPLLPVLVFLIFLNRRGAGKAAMLMLVIALWLLITVTAVFNGGIRAPSMPVYVVIILFVALLFGIRAAMAMAFLSTLTGLGLIYAEEAGLLVAPAKFASLLFIHWFAQLMTFYSTIGIVYLAIRDVREALVRAHQELAERQRTEEKLRSNEERFRAMIENISDAITLVNAQGAMIYLSPAAERIMGYSNAERMGMSSFDKILQVGDVSRLQQIFTELRAEPLATRSFEIQARHKDGSTRWLEVAATNLLGVESVQAIIVNYRDITERIHAEKEREKYIEEINSRNAELERFTYTVSHELKSPVVTMKGYIGSIAQDLHDMKYERAQKDLLRISTASDKLHETISDLLELSRIGRIINPPEEVDPAQLIRMALDNLGARIGARNIKVNVSPDLPMIYADSLSMREVFENLIENAAKNMGDQPDPAIEIGMRNHENEQVIFVRDNGIGIEEKYQTKIFALFEKLNPVIEGTGIGLALVKRIIETYSGRIWVESEGLGKGSTFYFTLPKPPESKTNGD
jgi:PAS domain S-box-containing protein